MKSNKLRSNKLGSSKLRSNELKSDFLQSDKLKSNFYKTRYNLIRIKRFLLQTTMIFAFQFLIIVNLNFLYPPEPMYPPMGITFTLFYLLGNNAFFGLFLAGFAAYFLKGLPTETLFLYLAADIIPSYLGAALSVRIFSSDIRPFARWQECLQFIKINAFVTCLISSLLRLIPLVLYYQQNLLYNWIDLWLADLNAILILSGFLFSWTYISFSREKISLKPFPIFMIIAAVGFIVLSVLFISYANFIYFILFAMVATLILSLHYGYLIATALLFIVSSIYFTFFMAHMPQFVQHFGLGLYTMVPFVLFLFTMSVLYLGHREIPPAPL